MSSTAPADETPLEVAESTWVRVPDAVLRRGYGPADVHAVRWDGGESSTTICVHGLGSSHLNWAFVAPTLAGHPQVGTVWSLDLPGFGLTRPGARGGSLTDHLDLLAGFVRTVAPERPVLVLGNSLGGLLALRLAAHHPTLVRALGLVAPACPLPLGKTGPAGTPVVRDRDVLTRFAAMSTPRLGEIWLARWRRLLTPAEHVQQRLRLSTADPDALDPRIVDAHIAMEEQRRQMPHADAALLAAARSLVATMLAGRGRYWRDVAAVDVPTLLVQGALDRLVQPAASEAFGVHRPDWPVHVYPHAGHVPILETPDEVADGIGDWLATLDPAVGPHR